MDLDKHKNQNGTYNGVDALSELTGLSKGDVKDIFKQVQENQAKLDGCAYHEFVLFDSVGARHKYMCVNCSGEINGTQYRWHELGRRPKP